MQSFWLEPPDSFERKIEFRATIRGFFWYNGCVWSSRVEFKWSTMTNEASRPERALVEQRVAQDVAVLKNLVKSTKLFRHLGW